MTDFVSEKSNIYDLFDSQEFEESKEDIESFELLSNLTKLIQRREMVTCKYWKYFGVVATSPQLT